MSESEPQQVEELPALDETPAVWRDGEEMLEAAALEADPDIIAEGETLGRDQEDWVESE